MENTQEAPNAWSVYLESNSAEDTVAMAEANGGSVIVDAMPVGDLGQMAVITDPGGAAVGIWQPGEHSGFAVRGEVDAPGWFEVLSNDYDATVLFYENVFGWVTHTMSDSPDFRYTTLGKDEHALAGIMAADGPSEWSTYVAVADSDATVAQAVELGGSEVDAAGGHAVRPARDDRRPERCAGQGDGSQSGLSHTPVTSPAAPAPTRPAADRPGRR